MNRYYKELLLEKFDNVSDVKRFHDFEIAKVKYWIGQGHNIESNERWIKETAEPVSAILDNATSIHDLLKLIKL